MSIKLGIDLLQNSVNWQNEVKGAIGLLCHSASVDSSLNFTGEVLRNVFGNRLKKFFGPQHGFVTDVQDNMVETPDYIHPYFKLPVHSLYSQTRIPTDEMLNELDTIIVDLQDVGTRVYTYIHTLTLLMEKCAQKNIRIVVLDRPNPVGGKIIEGSILRPEFSSFVGRFPIPQRHGMTIGEVALYSKKFHNINCDLVVVPMEGWRRDMWWHDTKLTWINPSPNLPTTNSAYVFPGTVLFEGTNISEGRGTTRSLEYIGHPDIEAFSFAKELNDEMSSWDIKGVAFRPQVFLPMFQKHKGTACGGVHIHMLNHKEARPWKVGQFLCHKLYQKLGTSFKWYDGAYEYEFDQLAIDLINGTDEIRKWVESQGQVKELEKLEKIGYEDYQKKLNEIALY